MADNPSVAENTIVSGLAQFVEDRFVDWRTNRMALQAKWDRNWDAFKGLTTGVWKKGEAEGWRSNTFIQATKSRVVSAYALVIDLLLQGGEIPMDLIVGPWQGVPTAQIPPEQLKVMEANAEAMKAKIKSQLAAGQADRAISKCILSEAIFGETMLKVTVRQYEETGWQIQPAEDMAPEDASAIPGDLQIWKKTSVFKKGPAPNYVSVYDIFRDMEDPNPRKGAGVIHRQAKSHYWLRLQKGRPFFINEAIDRVLARNPIPTGGARNTSTLNDADTSTLSPSQRNIVNRINNLIIKEFWGRAPRAAAEAFEVDMANGGKDIPSIVETEGQAGDEVEVHCITCDKEVIRYVRTELRDRPFYRGVWEEGLEEGESSGVADNIEDLQGVLNGAFRAFEDNKKLSANAIIALRERMIKNCPTELRPGLILLLKEDARSAQDAMSSIVIPDVGESLMSLINLCMSMLDNDSLIPRAQMGLGDDNRDVTAYEISTQMANSTKYIGSVIRRIDECLIEPVISYFYDYNMQDPSTTEQGNFMVQAKGFASYHDRLLQFDQLTKMLQIFMSNPQMAVNTNVRHCQELIAKALDQDADQVLVTEEKAMQMMQAMNTSPLQQAQQAKLEAEQRQIQSGAVLNMQKARESQETVKMKRAETAIKVVQAAREPIEQPAGKGGKPNTVGKPRPKAKPVAA